MSDLDYLGNRYKTGPPHEEPIDKDFMQAHIEELQALADKRLELLRRCASYYYCPICRKKIEYGHADDCELAKELE